VRVDHGAIEGRVVIPLLTLRRFRGTGVTQTTTRALVID
jgi:hypothetical protein